MEYSLSARIPTGDDGGTAPAQPIYIAIAESGTITCTVRDTDGGLFDLSSGALILTVKNILTASPVLAREAVVTVPISGAGIFSIVVEDTLSLAPGKYTYDVQWRPTAGGMYQVVPPSPFVLTPAVGLPGEDVTVPAAQQPLGLGPQGPQGDTGPQGPVGPPGTVGTLSAEAAVGTALYGVVSQDSTNANYEKYTPSDSGTTSWYQWAGSFDSAVGPRRNQVVRFGWNIDRGGGRVDTGVLNGVLASEYEQYFEGAYKQMERHETYVDPAGTQTRWITFEGHLESPYATALTIASTSVTIRSGTGTNDPARVDVDATQSRVLSPNGLSHLYVDNSQAWLTAGSGAGLARWTLYPSGEGYLQAKTQFGLQTTGAQFQILGDGGQTVLQSPNGTAAVSATNAGTLTTTPLTLADSQAPSTPASGFTIYSESGVLKCKDAAGVVHTFNLTP